MSRNCLQTVEQNRQIKYYATYKNYSVLLCLHLLFPASNELCLLAHPDPDVWLSLNAARMWWCLVFVRLPSRLHTRAVNEPSRSFSVQRRPLLWQSPCRKLLLPWYLWGQTSQFQVYLRCFYACLAKHSVFIVKALSSRRFQQEESPSREAGAFYLRELWKFALTVPPPSRQTRGKITWCKTNSRLLTDGRRIALFLWRKPFQQI